MHHILLAVDGSDWSEVAAIYALDWARVTREEVHALAVVPSEAMRTSTPALGNLARTDWIFETEHLGTRAVNDWFDNTEEACDREGLCFQRLLDVGKPVERLLWAAMTARLCVLGAHGADSPDKLKGLGRIATALARQALTPLLVTRRQYAPIKRVVLGWDGRSAAAHAAEVLVPLAKAHGWEIMVVAGAEETAPLAAQCAHIASALVEEGVPAQSWVTPGKEPETVFRAVEKFRPDLVAVGARREGEGTWWDLVEQLTVPVLLYR